MVARRFLEVAVAGLRSLRWLACTPYSWEFERTMATCQVKVLLGPVGSRDEKEGYEVGSQLRSL